MSILRKILYCWTWALSHLVRDRKQTFTTVAVITLSLLILEIFLLLFLNLQNLIHQWSGQLRIIIYLKDPLSQEELRTLEGELSQRIDCRELRYISKEQAWQEFKRDFRVDELLAGMDYSLLPATFLIELKEPLSSDEEVEKTTARLRQMSGVEDVEYGGIGTERFQGALLLFRSTIIVIGIVLSLSILIIAASTLKFSFQSWKIKIDILQMSGVNPWLIKSPVILAGSIQGLLSVCLSLGISFVLFKAFLFYFFYWRENSDQLLGSIPISFLSPGMSYGLVVGGTLLGSWSSWLFLQKNRQ